MQTAVHQGQAVAPEPGIYIRVYGPKSAYKHNGCIKMVG